MSPITTRLEKKMTLTLTELTTLRMRLPGSTLLNVKAEEPVVPYHTRGLLRQGLLMLRHRRPLQMSCGCNNSAREADDNDINGVKFAANMTTDVKPDATPHTDCKTLVANLKRQWNQGLIISIARPCMYIELNHIIDFISSHRSVEVNRDELTTQRHGAVLDQAMKRCPSPSWR